jgi:hypothetical protein
MPGPRLTSVLVAALLAGPAQVRSQSAMGEGAIAGLSDGVEIVVQDDLDFEGVFSQPRACPSAPWLVVVQRKLAREYLHIVDTRTGERTDLASAPLEDELGGPGGTYDGQADWMALPDEGGRHWLTFSGGGRFNNRDVYITYLGADRSFRLTSDREWDHSPRFAPDGSKIVFVSTRTGSGDLYVIDDVDEIRATILSGATPAPETGVVQLTTNPEPDVYPAIDPTGRFVAYSQFGRSEQEATTQANMGVAVLDLDHRSDPPARLTLDAVQETRPSWSPDGNRIAFYFSERLEDPEVQVGMVEVVYGEKSGVPRVGRLVETGVGREVARNVIPGDDRGPSWGARSESGHAKTILYIRKDAAGASRVVVADVANWEEGQPDFETRIEIGGVEAPEDVTWGYDGTALFAAQSDRRYGVFRAPLAHGFLADRGVFERDLVADPGGAGMWKWVAGGGAVVAGGLAVALLSGGDDGGDPPLPPNVIPDPPCPPGVECR